MNQQSKEEVDISDLIALIKKILNKIFKLFFTLFNFFIKNAIILIILIVSGILLGLFIDKKYSKLYKTDFIVATNYDAAEYLYNIIEEAEFKIENKDSLFLTQLGLQKSGELERISIQPVITIDELSTEQENFISLIAEESFITDDEKRDIIIRSAHRHKISLYHDKNLDSKKVLDKMIENFRKNDFYNSLYSEYEENIDEQLKSNKFMLSQLDSLIKKLPSNDNFSGNNNPSFYNSQQSLDVGEILEQRQNLQQDTKLLIEEKFASEEFLKIIYEGQIKSVETFNLRNIRTLSFPLIFVSVFILLKLVVLFYKKGSQLS